MTLKPHDYRNIAYIRRHMRRGPDMDVISFALTNTALMIRLEKGSKEARKEIQKLKKQGLIFADL